MIQPAHVILLGSIFCFVLFWVLLIVGVVMLWQRRAQRR